MYIACSAAASKRCEPIFSAVRLFGFVAPPVRSVTFVKMSRARSQALSSVSAKIGRVERLKEIRRPFAALRTRAINAAVSASGSPHSMKTSSPGDSRSTAASDPPPP